MTRQLRRPAVKNLVRTTALAAVTVAALTGCSKASDTTCSEFVSQSYSDQASTLRGLLDEHDLKMLDIGNTVGVTDAVTGFCSVSGNSTALIEDAVNWNSSTW